ncbi:MAG: hypothetical protein Q8928_16830 [Bacteroidota bacterium]|nr:hypothetical protein [Bacteroidota bacterium]
MFVLVMAGCATYYQKNLKFQQSVYEGNLEKADKLLEKDTKAPLGKNKVLYFLNRGFTSWMLGLPEKSNEYFSTADHLIEDQQKNYGLEALALVSNPMVKPYVPEDFEAVMLNYYTAMNYIRLGKFDEALVECKRIDIRLNKLNDKYPTNKNRYKRDAFAHTLMGLIYDATGNYNDAFIAYRNALEIYETDYAANFKATIPLQLKKDLLRTAYLTGFDDEVRRYEEKFGMKCDSTNKPEAELVFFWLNGFGPVKDEWSINFTQFPGDNPGWIVLANQENGLSFPIFIGDRGVKEQAAFKDLRFLRVAFPKYVERPRFYYEASLSQSGQSWPLEELENINEIAFKSLHDRMVREMTNSILRLAAKKAMEALADRENKNLGSILSIANALTEKADTRNWQTLPYTISYARIPLKEGANTVILKVKGANNAMQDYPFTFNAQKGQICFHAFQNVEIKSFSYGN